ncbi:Oidioi.mRNA.OKI2018_I69.PAR.g8925.t1.cds [Oikopleura dioica]|uniref:Oidioi.mRNA.OKI2018_I69.PAR.g8925.t1.cds n=1 Tax=Oikopleura dioica TaxID=34765 RepID=A0ABN7RLV1_OIKDI|nr:Oidioi.mRNA.OKI2018_I69.PAR.g8925.t1.cds [Oikopleura dioica]
MKTFATLIASAVASHSSYSSYYSSSGYSSYSSSSSSSSSSTSFEGECGGRITDTETIIYSPGFERGYYYNFLDCKWDIDFGDIAGFNIVANTFDVEWHSVCGWDTVTVEANGDEFNFCGSNGYRRRRSASGDHPKEEDEGKANYDLANPSSDGFPDFFVSGGQASISLTTDYSVRNAGFEFVFERMSRLQVIEMHLNRIFDSFSREEDYSRRYTGRMTRILNKMKASETGDSCYAENGFAAEAADIQVFDADNMCKLNGQLNAAINSWARNWACDGRGRVHRQIIRAARKVRNFYNDRAGC